MTCQIGSCQRHNKCMYHPCRNQMPADRKALERALDLSRGQINDDMYVTKQRLDQTHGFLKNYLSEQDT